MKRTGAMVSAMLVLLSLAVPATSSAAELRGQNHIYVYEQDPLITRDGTSHPIPGMASTFDLNRTRSVLATFCAESHAHGSLLVQVHVDGRPAIPGEVVLRENFDPDAATTLETHCFAFAVADVPRGTHTVTVSWRKAGTPPAVGQVGVGFRSLVVELL